MAGRRVGETNVNSRFVEGTEIIGPSAAEMILIIKPVVRSRTWIISLSVRFGTSIAEEFRTKYGSSASKISSLGPLMETFSHQEPAVDSSFCSTVELGIKSFEWSVVETDVA